MQELEALRELVSTYNPACIDCVACCEMLKGEFEVKSKEDYAFLELIKERGYTSWIKEKNGKASIQIPRVCPFIRYEPVAGCGVYKQRPSLCRGYLCRVAEKAEELGESTSNAIRESYIRIREKYLKENKAWGEKEREAWVNANHEMIEILWLLRANGIEELAETEPKAIYDAYELLFKAFLEFGRTSKINTLLGLIYTDLEEKAEKVKRDPPR